MIFHPIQMIETPELASHLFQVDVIETRRYSVLVRVVGEPSSEKALKAAREHADDCVESGELPYDYDRTAHTEERATVTPVEKKLIGVENITSTGEEVTLMQPIPPDGVRFKIDGVDWACNGHLLIRVDAYPDGIGCMQSDEWKCLGGDEQHAVDSMMKHLRSVCSPYEPLQNTGPCFQARYFQFLVRPEDRFALAKPKNGQQNQLVLLVIREGAPVAALSNAASDQPATQNGQTFDHLANILADMAKAQVPS